MKIACVIQGDYRRGTSEVLKFLPKFFDHTIFSTWEERLDRIPDGNFLLIVNEKPEISGFSNRNLQRFSTARGITLAKELGCDYILKWRSDMLPTKLDVEMLLKWANYDVPSKMKSRLVMPAYRNLSIRPDSFSSIPDLFSFADIHIMEILWGDKDFNYANEINVTDSILKSNKLQGLNKNLIESYYPPESELYALFKERLQSHLGLEINHSDFVLDYCRLINESKLGIYWFGALSGFRCIHQGYEHRWWTETDWQSRSPTIQEFGYPIKGIKSNFYRLVGPFLVRFNEIYQSFSWWIRKYINDIHL